MIWYGIVSWVVFNFKYVFDIQLENKQANNLKTKITATVIEYLCARSILIKLHIFHLYVHLLANTKTRISNVLEEIIKENFTLRPHISPHAPYILILPPHFSQKKLGLIGLYPL